MSDGFYIQPDRKIRLHMLEREDRQHSILTDKEALPYRNLLFSLFEEENRLLSELYEFARLHLPPDCQDVPGEISRRLGKQPNP